MQPDRLQLMIDRALARSAATLSEMSGVPIAIVSSEVERVPLVQVPLAVGQPDEPAVGVYVGIEGDGAGYLLLLMDEPTANDLAELMLGEPCSVHDALGVSALAEAGNVACSAFMNELGEAANMRLMAMPPFVVGDMRGAILDIAIADIALTGDEALLIKTHLGPANRMAQGERLNAQLLAIPTPETLNTIRARLAA